MNISWEDYLKEIKDNPYTGKWAKEVAGYLLARLKNQDFLD